MRIEIFRQRQSLKSKKLKSYILNNFATVSKYKGRKIPQQMAKAKLSLS